MGQRRSHHDRRRRRGAAGARLGADWAAIAGFLLLGAGLGITYRTALVTMTRGAVPARQGALASLYAGTTYTVAAAVVLLVGVTGNAIGLVTATAAALTIFGVLAAIALPWTTRLRDTVDTSRVDGQGSAPSQTLTPAPR